MTNRLNLHIDESGNQNLSEGLYIVTVVLHNHAKNVSAPIHEYEKRLVDAGIDNVAFHQYPL